MKRTLLLFLVLATVFMTSKAQTFTAITSHKTVQMGEQFKLTLEISGNTAGGEITPPSFQGFTLVAGPMKGSQTTNINGHVTQKTTFSYYLQPTKPGTFTIPSAALTIQGNVIKTDPIEITVKKAAEVPTGKNKDIFIQLSLDKSKAYVGEQITATYTLFTRLDIVQNQVTDAPSFDGFYSSPVELDENRRFQPTVVNGQKYFKVVLMQNVLTPQYAGELSIDPVVFKAVVQVQSKRAPRSVFDSFFGRVENKEINVTSPTRKVTIKALPKEGRNSLFTGAVGQFSHEAITDRDTVPSNEGINLKLTVSGKGNFSLIDEPKLNFPPDFEVYDPKVSNHYTTNASGTKGRKVWEYLIIPRHEGLFELPVLDFQYFDPKKKKYITVKQPTKTIYVTKGDESAANVVSGGVNKTKVSLLNEDIRYIKPASDYKNQSAHITSDTPLFYALLAGPWALLLVLIGWKRKHQNDQKDIGKLRNKKARNEAKKRLKLAKNALDKQNTELFYEEIHKAIFGYVADKTNVSLSQVGHDAYSSYFASIQTPENLIDEGKGIIETCEMARFAPGGIADATSLYEKTESWFNRIINK